VEQVVDDIRREVRSHGDTMGQAYHHVAIAAIAAVMVTVVTAEKRRIPLLRVEGELGAA
jgi:hypothetical protein